MTSQRKMPVTNSSVKEKVPNLASKTEGRSQSRITDENKRRFSEVLSGYIKTLGLKQKDLAAEARASASEVTEWVNGKRVPGRAMVGELAWAIWHLAKRSRGHIISSVNNEMYGMTLIDVVNELQNASGHPPNIPAVDIVWEQRVLAHRENDRKLYVGYVPAHPFATRERAGLSLDITEKIIGWLGATPSYREFSDWDELVPAIINKEIHLAAPLLFRGIHYKARGIELSEGIGIRIGHVVLFPLGALKELKRTGDLEDKKNQDEKDIPTLRPSALIKVEVVRCIIGSSAMLFQQFKPEPMFSQEFWSLEDAVNALSEQSNNKGKIRCLVVSAATSQDLRQSGNLFDEAYLPSGLDFPLALAFGAHPQEGKLLVSINTAISEMKCSGVMRQLFETYLPELHQHGILVDRDVMHPLAEDIRTYQENKE